VGVLLLILLLCSTPASAELGLRTRFSDAILENLELGRSYNLRELRRLPYTIINCSTVGIDVLTEMEIPAKEACIEGYEPIPDPNWVQIIPNRTKIGVNENVSSDIVVTVPNDTVYVGRHFQVAIWSHTLRTGMLGVGVRSRLRFSTGQGPETLKKEKQIRGLLTLDIDMTPSSVYVLNVPAGKKVDLRKEKNVGLKLTNRTDAKVVVKVEPVPYNVQMGGLPPGYEPAPDLAWLELKPQKVKVNSNQIVDIKIFINIPDRTEYKGKKFVFLVKGEVSAKDVLPIELYTKVFVTLK